MREHPEYSMDKHAAQLNWFYNNGQPHKSKVNRLILAQAERLVKKERGKYVLTKAGEKAVPRAKFDVQCATSPRTTFRQPSGRCSVLSPSPRKR